MSSNVGMRVRRDPPAVRALRLRVREFLAEARARGIFTPAVDGWHTAWNAEFSRELGRAGWLGMTLPREYGGHGLSYQERFAVTEELLAAGAPVAAHWVADRQSGPSIVKFGTEEQKRAYLPGIATGEMLFAIGMSEPNSGSDLAAVATRGEKVDGGWMVTGNKVWTSGAHLADAFLLLARTSPRDAQHRHRGLTQFIVDLRSPGIDIRPIMSMSGIAHFNEVFLDNVFVPDSRLLGEVGEGWHQVTSELSFERSGPERFLSTFRILHDVVDGIATGVLDPSADIGAQIARLAGLHTMSMSVSHTLARGEDAGTVAALVKVLGTIQEGDIVATVDDLLGDLRHRPGVETLAALIEDGLLLRPGFSLRGGTNEILRGVIARGLGMR
jgi:acyl-CoA dehydrogenase